MDNTLYIYTRISSVEQESGYSIENQLEQGINRAKLLGMDYVHMDEGVQSGSKEDIHLRPVFRSIIEELIPNGTIKHLFGKELTRLSRNTSISNMLLEICIKHKVWLYSVSHKLNVNDPAQYFIAQLELQMARLESQRLGERVRDGMRKSFQAGKKGGDIPYGYTRGEDGVLVIHPEQGKVVELIFDLYVNKGMGQTNVANELNKMGYMTQKGTFWNSPSVGRVLRKTIYYGKLYYKRTDEWFDFPAIITKEQYDAARKVSSTRKNYEDNNLKNEYLFRKFLVCGRCGSRILGYKSPDYFAYRCFSKHATSKVDNCHLPSISVRKLEDPVWYHIVETFTSSDNFIKDSKKEFKRIENKKAVIDKSIVYKTRQLKDFNTKRDNISAMYIEGTHRKEFLDDKMKEIILLIEDTERELVSLHEQVKGLNNSEDELNLVVFNIGRIEKYFLLEDFEEKREFLQSILDHILVEHNGEDHVLTFHFKHGISSMTKTYKELKGKLPDHLFTKKLHGDTPFKPM